MDSVLGLVRHAGNDGLFKAIEMSLLATAAGQPLHLHAEGLRGTGKTTIMRAVRRVLPRIRRIKDCLYNCDPAYPHCPRHRGLSAEEIAALGDEWVPMPFLEISHSAKVGTVVGSIDLGRLVSPTQPEAALLPGTIPQAHRGIMFVDEINRLAETAPELADILLDVMGTKPGRVQIEETGLPAVELPVQVTVWAASNPDEDPGPLEDIRRQLSDRFDFVVYTDRPGEAAVVEEILSATSGANWHRPLSPSHETQAELYRSRVAGYLPALRRVQVPKPLRQQVAEIYSRFNVESLRAVQAIQLGMRLAACLDQRDEATLEDLARITPLALRHRVDQETIKKITGHLVGLNSKPEASAAGVQNGAVKGRYPNISFGAAAVEPAPERTAATSGAQGQGSGQAEADKPARAGEPGGPGTEWATQHPPRRDAQPPDTWLSRTLQSVRRNLGLQSQEPVLRPEQGLNRYTSPPGRGLTPPRQGSLFQRAEEHQMSRAGRPGLGLNAGGRGQDGQAQGGQAPQAQAQSRGNGAGRSDGEGRGQPGEGRAPMQVANPLDTPPVAPPNAARPISQLEPHELIRTEEELGRR